MKKAEIIENLRHAVYARLMPSPIAGVGIFAIRDIPAGINPFGEYKMGFAKFRVSEIREDPQIPDAVKKYVEDMCATSGGYIYLPSSGINNIHLDFFFNHSKNPNMRVDENELNFITLRRIKTGEELTVDYDTYNDEVIL